MTKRSSHLILIALSPVCVCTRMGTDTHTHTEKQDHLQTICIFCNICIPVCHRKVQYSKVDYIAKLTTAGRKQPKKQVLKRQLSLVSGVHTVEGAWNCPHWFCPFVALLYYFLQVVCSVGYKHSSITSQNMNQVYRSCF